jgi:hypothetical protein
VSATGRWNDHGALLCDEMDENLDQSVSATSPDEPTAMLRRTR